MRKIICFLMTITILNCSALASNYKILSEEKIEFVLTEKTPDTLVGITVLNPDMQLSDSETSENEKEVFAAYKETMTDADGNLDVSFKTDGKSGIYSLLISADNTEEYTQEEIYFVRLSENETARTLLDANEDISAIISEYKYALGVDDSLVSEDVTAAAGKIYKASVPSSSSLTAEEVWTNLNKALAISNFSNGKTEFFSDYYEYFEIAEDIQKWIDKEYMTDSVKDNLTQKLKKDFESFEDFDNSLLNAVVLTTVYKCDGYGFAKEILTQYASKLGIDSNKITDAVCRKIAGSDCESVQKLALDIENYYDDFNSSSSGGGRGGSSKSSSSSKVSGVSVDNSFIPQKPALYVEEKIPFTDIANYDWAKDAINYLYELSIVNGKEEGKYFPGDNVLREEFVKMVMQSIGFSDLYGDISFDDVSVDDWYYADVKNAYLCNIINGISETSFGSGMMITRQDMAKILYNALIKKGISLNGEKTIEFADFGNISDYAVSAVEVLCACGIINGDDKGNFNPQNYATRAETAKMIYNALTYMRR